VNWRKDIKDLDPEVINLCDSLNSIDGIETIESCCGHEKTSFDIWFKARDINSLYVVSRFMDNRYNGINNNTWSCVVEDVDSGKTGEDCVIFCISSGNVIGKKAYEQANILSSEINKFLSNKKFMKMFTQKNT
jgi:hypothetical protein